MTRYEFDLRIPAARYVDYYRGAIRHVVARAHTGQTVQFPASLLQSHLTPEGIHGHFILTCNEANKCISLERAPEA